MPRPAPEGFTHIEDAPEKWGGVTPDGVPIRTRNWWYTEVREGRLTGYDVPGLRGTFLSDNEVEAYLRPKPIERPRDNMQSG